MKKVNGHNNFWNKPNNYRKLRNSFTYDQSWTIRLDKEKTFVSKY